MRRLEAGKKMMAPSLLAADFSRLEEALQTVSDGGAEIVHLDVMDGHFVPNLSFGAPVIRALRKKSPLYFDVHLMIENAESSWEAYADAGADMITVHVEAVTHIHRLLTAIRERGLGAGVVLNPGTPLSSLEELLPYLDMVLLMSVNPGFGGQSFIPGVRDKIRRLRSLLDREGAEHVRIEVDGGVDLNNLPELLSDGADIFVAGSAVFAQEDPVSVLKQMQGILNKK